MAEKDFFQQLRSVLFLLNILRNFLFLLPGNEEFCKLKLKTDLSFY